MLIGKTKHNLVMKLITDGLHFTDEFLSLTNPLLAHIYYSTT
jgi:hypothetical protein